MKKLMFILLIGVLMTSCGPYIEYDIDFRTEVPDSLKEAHREYLIELVTAASNQNGMSAGKARDLDDVLWRANRIANDMFSITNTFVCKKYYENNSGGHYDRKEYIKIEDLDEDKSELYIYYKMLETGKPYKVKLSKK